jgi:hypothetical protein
LLWLTVVVALGAAWWLDRRALIEAHWITARELAANQRWEHRAKAIANALQRAGWTVEFPESGGSNVQPPPNPSAPAINFPSE